MAAHRKKRLTEEQQNEIYESIHKDYSNNFLNRIKIDIKAKTPNQKKLINEIWEKEIVICSGPAGTGKTFLACATALELLKKDSKYKKIVLVKSVTPLKNEELGYLKGPQPLYEKVLTPNGWVQMGEIKIGDEVITDSGEATKVIGVFDQENENLSDIYRITTKDGRYADSCLNHKWNVRTNKLDYFTVDTNFLINHSGKADFYLPELNPVQYHNNDNTTIDPYLLGVLIGDGCLSSGHVRFCSVDDEIVDKVKKIVEKYGLNLTKNNISHTITPTRSGTQRGAKEIVVENINTGEKFVGYSKDITEKFKIGETTLCGRCNRESVVGDYKFSYTGNISKSSNLFKEMLIDLNILGLKCYEKYIPEVYKFSTVENRIELLRGLLDTDGTIKKNGEITYVTTSEKLADDLRELVWSLGGSARKYVRRVKQRNQILKGSTVYQRRDCYTITVRFSNNKFNPFYLTRKAERFKPTKSDHLKISKIEKIGQSKIRCIKVDSPSELYVTKDFIVTHNTLKDKIEHFMYSYTHNFEKIIGKQNVENLKLSGFIEEMPIAYMRGINIDDSIIIIDETQNITIDNIRTIMTRLGSNSKMIFLGDENQIDMKKKSESSLEFILNKFSSVEEVGTVKFDGEDVVRNPLIKKIEKIFSEK